MSELSKQHSWWTSETPEPSAVHPFVSLPVLYFLSPTLQPVVSWASNESLGRASEYLVLVFLIVCIGGGMLQFRTFRMLRGFLIGGMPGPASTIAFHLAVGIFLSSIAYLAWYDLKSFTSFGPFPKDIWAHYRFIALYASAMGAVTSLIQAMIEGPRNSASIRLSPLNLDRSRQSEIESTFCIAHISDLHITRPGRKTCEGQENSKEVLPRIVASLKSNFSALDAIILTGDVTDTGHPEEWSSFLSAAQDVRPKLIMIPGNHDINFSETAGFFGYADPSHRALRIFRWLVAMDDIQGDRTQVVVKDGLKSFREYLAEHEATFEYLGRRFGGKKPSWIEDIKTSAVESTSIEDFITRVTTRRRPRVAYWEIQELWANIFPLLVTVANSDLGIVVLNSNDQSSSLATNAFGYFGAEQQKRLTTLLKLRSGRPTAIALHHHIGMPVFARQFIPRIQERGLVLSDGPLLASTIAKFKKHSVVFNGHRHQRHIHGAHLIDIVSAPSTTLGDGLSSAPLRSLTNSAPTLGYGIYHLAWQMEVGIWLAEERWQYLE